MIDFIKLLIETRATFGRGSAEGRSSINTHKKNIHSTPEKSKVEIFKSITDALRNGKMGQIFSTIGSNRLYVITKQKWGKDKEQIINGRSAKGFTKGSIPSTFGDVRKYSRHVMAAHSGKKID